MSKRYWFYIAGVVLIITLSTTIWFVLISPVSKNEDSAANEIILKSESLRAVPIDAVGIMCYSSASELYDSYISASSPISPYIDKGSLADSFTALMYKALREPSDLRDSLLICQPVISLHYSAKNDLSLLFSLRCNAGGDFATKLISKAQSMWSLKEYNFEGMKITGGDGFWVSYSGGFLVYSTSRIVLESSLRHLSTQTSILDNGEFKKIFDENSGARNMVALNSQNVGKLFSGLFDSQIWKFSEFFRNSGSWLILTGEGKKGEISFAGNIYNSKGLGAYSSIFRGVEPGKIDAPDILPSGTLGLFSISSSDFGRYLKNRERYSASNKLADSSQFIAYSNWFKSLKCAEVSAAYIDNGTSFEWITLLRCKNNITERDSSASRALKVLFGELYGRYRDEIVRRVGDWMILGSVESLKLVESSVSKDSTLGNYFRKEIPGRFHKNGGAVMYGFIGEELSSQFKDSFFNRRVNSFLSRSAKDSTHSETIFFTLLPDEDLLRAELHFVSQK